MMENLTSEVSVPQEDNRYFSFNLFDLTSIKLQEYTRVSSHRGISKQILNRGYHSIKLCKEGQKDLQSPRYSTWMLDHKFIKVTITEIECPGCPSEKIYQKALQITCETQGWTYIKLQRHSD